MIVPGIYLPRPTNLDWLMLYILDKQRRRYKAVAANLLHVAGWSIAAALSGTGAGLALVANSPWGGGLYLGLTVLALITAYRAYRMEINVVDGTVVARNHFSSRVIHLDEIQEFKPVGRDTIAVGARLKDGREVTLSAVASFRRGAGVEIFSHKVVRSLNEVLEEWRCAEPAE